MSQERKFKAGDRVKVVNSEHWNGQVGVVESVATSTYFVRLSSTGLWFSEDALSRAPSSPDEQDIENAGGSERRPVHNHGTEEGKGLRCRETIAPDGRLAGECMNLSGGSATPEAVQHPAHYGGEDNPYEAIKVIEAWGLGFHLGNVAKYVARAGKKDPAAELQDLQKAAFYLQRHIDRLEIAGGKK